MKKFISQLSLICRIQQFLHVCLSIFIYYWIINQYCYNLHVKLQEIIPSKYVKVQNTIVGIPDDVVIYKFVVNSSMPIPPIEYVKFYKNNQDLKEVKCYTDEYEKDVNTKEYNSSAGFVIMKNMYVSFAGTYTMYNFSFLDVETNPAIKYIREHPNGKVINGFPLVIGFGHSNTHCFGHWFYDVLAPLVLIPQEIIDISYVIAYQKRKMALDTLLPLGIKEDKIIFMNRGQWVFAERLIAAVEPTPHISHFNKATLILSQKLRNYYNFDKIIPTKYCFSNRKVRRRITNFHEIYRAAVNMFPQYHLLIAPDYKDFGKYGKLWAESKFMFMPTGSNFAKSLFMSENSVLVVGLGDILDQSVGLSAKSHHVFVLYFEIVGMKHFGSYGHSCDVSLALRVISIGLYCAKYGHWKSGENFTYVSSSIEDVNITNVNEKVTTDDSLNGDIYYD